MKSIRWTSYARKKTAKREVTIHEVEQTIAHPDSVTPGKPPRRIFTRRYWDSVLKSDMLLRVVVKENDDAFVIVTIYKTSKFHKYEGERMDEN